MKWFALNDFFVFWLEFHQMTLSHWGRVTHICVSKLTIIGSDNGLSTGRRQAIVWFNAGILLIGPLGTNFSEIYIKIPTLSFKKMRLKVSSVKWRPLCLGLDVLMVAELMKITKFGKTITRAIYNLVDWPIYVSIPQWIVQRK